MKNSVLETHKYDWLPRELELLQVSYLKYEAQKTQKNDLLPRERELLQV